MEAIFDETAIIRQLIQPPKLTYGLISLGPPTFELQQKLYERIDFSVKTKDNFSLNCSLFRQKEIKPTKILVYLHCNNGSRVEAMQYAHRSLEMGFGFLCYDSRACGLSGGQYITLGFRQAEDLRFILQELQNQVLKTIECQYILWGRSMGAATAIKYLQKKNSTHNILLLVLDSPFLNLKEVIHEAGKKKMGIPNFLADLAIKYIDPIIVKKIGYSINHYNFQQSFKKIKCPLILMASKNDGLIPESHFVRIYDIHKGKKTVFYLDEIHTDYRNQQTINKVFKALTRYIAIDQQKKKEQNCLKSYRSEYTARRKSLSSQKLSIASKEIMLSRSNSAAKRKNIITLKLNKTALKQNQTKKIYLSSKNQKLRGKIEKVSQFEIERRRTIKILNMKNLMEKKNTLRMY